MDLTSTAKVQCAKSKRTEKKFAEMNRNKPNTGLTHQTCFKKITEMGKSSPKNPEIFIRVKVFQNVLQCLNGLNSLPISKD